MDSIKNKHPQTMPFDQIWPDLGFLWIGVSYFSVFQKIWSWISLWTTYMDFIKNRLPQTMSFDSIWPDLGVLWTGGIIFHWQGF